MRRVVLPAIGPSPAAEPQLRAEIMRSIEPGFAFARAELLPLATTRSTITGDALTLDGRFDEAFRRLREVFEIVSDGAKRALNRLFRVEDTRNERRVNETLRRVLGIDITEVMRRENLEDLVETAVTRNVSLIKGLGSEISKRIELTVLESAQNAETYRQLSQRLREIHGFSQRRARLIARDQLGKFSGDLNRQRQEALGITEYVWDTSLDERVRGNPDGRYPNARPSHWERHGKTFKWSSPPVDGHPGIPIQCRCVARGVVELEGVRPEFKAEGI